VDIKDPQALEKFYVYRSLHSDESWGVVLVSGEMHKLPNITFGMKVFEVNEKAAIAKAKKIYDRIHLYDNDKRNVREFVAAYIYKGYKAKAALRKAIEMNEEYKEHFKGLEENDE